MEGAEAVVKEGAVKRDPAANTEAAVDRKAVTTRQSAAAERAGAKSAAVETAVETASTTVKSPAPMAAAGGESVPGKRQAAEHENGGQCKG